MRDLGWEPPALLFAFLAVLPGCPARRGSKEALQAPAPGAQGCPQVVEPSGRVLAAPVPVSADRLIPDAKGPIRRRILLAAKRAE